MSIESADISDIMYGIILGRGSEGIDKMEVYHMLRVIKPSIPEQDLQIVMIEAAAALCESRKIESIVSYLNRKELTTYCPL